MAVFLFPTSVEYHSGCEVPVKVQIAHDGVVALSGHAWEVVHKGYSHLPSFILTRTQRTAATTRAALQGPVAPGLRGYYTAPPWASRGLLEPLVGLLALLPAGPAPVRPLPCGPAPPLTPRAPYQGLLQTALTIPAQAL